MANELRQTQNFIGGLVEDNPLTSGATTLTSAGLVAITGGVPSTHHMPIVLDPDGLDGAPEIAHITAHTAAAGSCTFARGMEGTTARAHARDIPWIHGFVTSDTPITYYSQPTDASTRASSTLGALSTPWTQVVTLIHASMVVDYDVVISGEVSVDANLYAALVRGGTIIQRTSAYIGAARETPLFLRGMDIPGSVGPHTYEVYVASSSGTLTVNTSVDTSTSTGAATDGVSSLKIVTRWRNA